MTTKRELRFGGISIKADPTWVDVTGELERPDAPFTIAKGDVGVGALQFSIAFYRSGKKLEVTLDHLRKLLQNFAQKHQQHGSLAPSTYEGKTKNAAATFADGESFVRVWYCSDGRNIALVTYTCAVADWGDEARECEEIVQTICFDAGASA